MGLIWYFLYNYALYFNNFNWVFLQDYMLFYLYLDSRNVTLCVTLKAIMSVPSVWSDGSSNKHGWELFLFRLSPCWIITGFCSLLPSSFKVISHFYFMNNTHLVYGYRKASTYDMPRVLDHCDSSDHSTNQHPYSTVNLHATMSLLM